MGSLRERLSVPEFKNQREKQEFLQSMVNGEVEVVPFMNGGMGVGITEKETLEAMDKARGIGVYSAALPGHRIAQEGVELQTPRHLEEVNAEEIQRLSKYLRERFELSIRGVNFMEILPSYPSSRDEILKGGAFDILCVGAGMDEKLPARMAEANAELHKKEPGRSHYYWPIVSSVLAARAYYHRFAKRGKEPKSFMTPGGYYVELPIDPRGYEAGGHLGFPKNKPRNPDDFNPEAILAGIRKFDPKSPIIYAGGIAYRNQIQEVLDMGYSGVSMGTRILLTQESGMPNEILKNKYLNPDIGVVVDQNSPTGYWSSRLDVPYTERTAQTIQEAIDRCVNCVGDVCEFRKNRKDPENTAYCIYRDLIRARLGDEVGVFFSGGQVVVMRHDDLYHRNGGLYIPTIEEAVEFSFTHDAPEIPAS
ncbi:nitronate monooxygenase [Patescibacteria group bacterium]|nr:nitronate monooxygenase [Patescibacteria group bacterium]MBU2259664.1 nitronate monooxygenase [Patescibacteria group bacterium]